MANESVVTGFAALNKRIFNLQRALPEEIRNALVIEETGTLKDAVDDCPWKTHDLQNSGKLGEPEVHGHETSIIISFGDGLTYATYVHENLEANHPNGGHAKFLENAVNKRIPGKSARIAKNINLNRALGL